MLKRLTCFLSLFSSGKLFGRGSTFPYAFSLRSKVSERGVYISKVPVVNRNMACLIVKLESCKSNVISSL